LDGGKVMKKVFFCALVLGAIPLSAMAGYVQHTGDLSVPWLNWVAGTSSGYNPLTLIYIDYWPSSNSPVGPGTPYTSLCTDPLTSGLGSAIVVESALKDYQGNRGLAAAWLWQQYFSSVGTDSVKVSALQAAIWEVMVESTSNPYDITAGSVYLTDTDAHALSVKAQANAWLSAIPGTIDPMTVSSNIRVLDQNPNHQPFIIEVPEPTTIAVLGLGGLLMARSRRRS
jgi:hypothetical protein